MRFKVHKLFFIWDFDKEEKWLNEMAEKGMNLVSVGFFKFVFEEGVPGKFQYNLEWLKHFPNHPESIAYRRFLEETGFEEVATFKKWLFIRKNSSEMAFNLFSDIDSRIEHLRRIMIFVPLILFILLVGFGFELSLLFLYQESISTISCIIVIFLLMLCFLIMGFAKSVKAYRVLKKERLIRE